MLPYLVRSSFQLLQVYTTFTLLSLYDISLAETICIIYDNTANSHTYTWWHFSGIQTFNKRSL